MEFDAHFSKPKACYEYLFKLKWPSGFVCNKCGNHHTQDSWEKGRHRGPAPTEFSKLAEGQAGRGSNLYS